MLALSGCHAERLRHLTNLHLPASLPALIPRCTRLLLTCCCLPAVPAPAPQQAAPAPAPTQAARAPAPAPLQTQFPPAPGPSPVQLIANLILANANLSLPLSQADEQSIIQSVLQVLPPGYTASDISLGSAQSLAQAASAPAFSTNSQAGRRLLQVGEPCVALTSNTAQVQRPSLS